MRTGFGAAIGALWVGAALGTVAQTQAAARHVWLPEGEIFAAPLAAATEAHNTLGFSSFRPREGTEDFVIGLASLGLQFPFYRLEDSRVGGDWQLGFFATFKSQFNMSESSDPLLNTDYFVGFPLSFRNQRWSARARLYHQSSHLGDELLLSGEAPPREDLSYEAGDLLVAYSHPAGWRVYAGGAYILSSDLPKIGDTSGHSGIDYRSPRPVLWKGRLVMGVDALSADAFDPNLQIHGVVGLRFGGVEPGDAAVTVAVEAFDGPIPFGQFFDDDETRYVGGVLYFELD